MAVNHSSEKPSKLIRFFDQAGRMFIYLKESMQYIITARLSPSMIIAQTAAIGFDSIPMALLICCIAGTVLSLQATAKFAQTGADAYVGGLVALAIVREIAPIFACLSVGARSGTAIAAEIANMKVTSQIDALDMMHISPIRYLFVPRLIACVISLPMLTLLGELIGVLGGMLIARQVSGMHYNIFLNSIWLHLKPYDVWVSLIKAMVFGVILAIVCCTIGLTTKGGAKDVGESTTKAAVWTAIVMIITDFALTWIFFGTSQDV